MMSERNRLVFLDDGLYSFGLQDLLGGSAEVLGRGSVGTSYKSEVDEEGTTMVVKRLKDVTVTKNEFELQMDSLAKVPEHENLLPVIAFHFSQNEKLLVSDFMTAGSLPALLHGNRGSDRTPLDWDSRMKIAISSARGLAHLHVWKIVHGNIKSSNVLLRPDLEQCCLSDYGLNSLFGTSLSTPANRITRFYCAPEVVGTGEVTFESDVYSFGVLLLELLTGKAPNSDIGEDGMNLPKWVQSTPEIFDVELMHHGVYEMVQLLQSAIQLLKIALSCVTSVVDQRPSMKEVVRLIEDLKRIQTEGTFDSTANLFS